MLRYIVVVGVVAAALIGAFHFPSGIAAQGGRSTAGNDADREMIAKSARDFAEAFNKKDAKSIAALWTENGECRDAAGLNIVGRAAIEAAYAEQFKSNPTVKTEAIIKSIRFPARDLAIEEGLLRQSRGPKDLPTTTAYTAVHVRDAGQWKIALSTEDGAGQDRLEDLEWLLGEWTGKVKDDTVKLILVRETKKPHLTATMTRTAPGQEPIAGSIRIALDPETGHLRSWGFEDDGAHSQALWHCDGKSWILDCRGVLSDGTATAERIVLQRAGADVITWRVIDRVVGEARVADTPPMRLTRAANK